jgi:hypothetical protein
MPSKTKMKNAAIAARSAALPSIPKELIDLFVTGPMSGDAVNAASVAFKKALIERAMGAELSHHLGYPPGADKPEEASNHRNGTSGKTVLTDTGSLRIEVPRDREGSYEPVLIPKHERRFTGFDDKILALYARGMPVREIQGFLAAMYAVEVSPDLIRRRIVHIAVTDHPTAAWTAQQLREAFPWDNAPKYLLRDRDHAFSAMKGIGVQEIVTAPRSPWQNAYVERFIGSVRRECLDHVIILTAAGLRRVLTEYIAYSRTRTHLGLNKDAPVTRPVASSTAGCVIAVPAVGGLHHRYERRAA